LRRRGELRSRWSRLTCRFVIIGNRIKQRRHEDENSEARQVRNPRPATPARTKRPATMATVTALTAIDVIARGRSGIDACATTAMAATLPPPSSTQFREAETAQTM
jgi:hypothetical protein